VPLSLKRRRVGDVTVIACSGGLMEGPASATVEQEIVGHLAGEAPYVALNLQDLDFIDSGGLGLLVRLRARARSAGGDLKLCAIPPRMAEVLRITRLGSAFALFDSEAAAVTAFYHDASISPPDRFSIDILCVNSSPDVLAYACQVLRHSGYAVMACGNLSDALVLLKAAAPKAVVIDAPLRADTGTQTSTAFNDLVAPLTVVELPADFSRREAGAAGARLLDQVRAALGGRDAPAPS